MNGHATNNIFKKMTIGYQGISIGIGIIVAKKKNFALSLTAVSFRCNYSFLFDIQLIHQEALIGVLDQRTI